MNFITHRRRFLQQASLLGIAASGINLQAAQPTPKRVAGVVTLFRRNSHADVLLSKILQGWKEDGGPGPNLKLVSLYVDQFPAMTFLSSWQRSMDFACARLSPKH